MTRRCINKTIYNNVYSQYRPPTNTSQLQSNQQPGVRGLDVYRFVFTTKLALGAAFVLCISLLLQPVVLVQAQEIDASGGTVESTQMSTRQDDTAVEAPNPTNDAESLMSAVSDDGDEENETEDVMTEVTTQAGSLVGEASTLEPVAASDQETESEPEIATGTSDETIAPAPEALDEADSPSNGATATTATSEDEAPANNSSSTEEATSSLATSDEVESNGGSITAAEPAVTSAATTTTSADGQLPSDSDEVADAGQVSGEGDTEATNTAATTTSPEPTVVSTVQTDNVLAFNKNECTEVEDGSFYCQKIAYDTLAENDLFAAPDANGDMEIYVVQNGEQIKITDNTVDDASPYYDARSKTIVWHRLLHDRYQIISYDVETGVETQVTATAVNNMEPTRNGSYTVWQRWVQNNWEIILLKDGVETQITDSIEHDIAPHIRGDLIIWNVRSSDGTESLMTYDIGSEIFNEIKDTDGVSVSNPRMLVMYEAQYQNGDTVMKGFDLVTGEVIPIERIPRELPADLPNPETTGEVRALPTNPQTEEELLSDSDLDTDEPVDDVPAIFGEDDLVLTATTTATTSQPESTPDFELDLRSVEPVATTSDALVQQATIPDVVVPAFNPNDGTEQASSTQAQ